MTIRVHAFSEPAAYERFSKTLLVLPPARELQRDGADMYLAVERDRCLAARCSLWWSNGPALDGARAGCIGHYAAADYSAAETLLDNACQQLATRGCGIAIGPLDGSTWRKYRFVVERGVEPPFFLEPDNPDDWPAQFTRCGFRILARYSSALTEVLDKVDDRVPQLLDRLTADGVRLRAFDPRRAEADLEAIYDVSIESFSRNFLFTQIRQDEFLSQYFPLLPSIDPELVLLAERGDRPVGFLFAIPDVLRPPAQGGPRDTVIIKTVGIRHGRAHAGLGAVLVARAHSIAHAHGYRRAIHALMHEANESRNLSRRYARTIRRYALFARTTAP
jgi:GNAT superfamily N-acetyltransferase